MNELKRRIEQLETISSNLEVSAGDREIYLREVHNFAENFLESLPETKAYSRDQPDAKRFAVDGEVKSILELLAIYRDEVANVGIKPASAGHMGYIPGGGLYGSALADFLIDITNEYAGIYFSSPGAVSMENALIEWLRELFGFPEGTIGNLTSGGSIATLIAFTAARDRHRIKGEKIATSVVYLTEQVHHCVHKTLRIIGLEDVIIRNIGLDPYSRIDVSKLRESIRSDREGGLNPFLVVASAGTTDTGAVDPLDEVASVAQTEELWYHIDAAYGGFFILCEDKRHLFEGIHLADSLVVDPHKGLFLPFGIGAVLVKDREAVFQSNHYFASYMQDAMSEELPVNPADVSPELTKHFRGLRMWLPLQLHGIKPFAACLEEKLLLTKYFRARLEALGFSVGPEPDLSITYFWYPAKDRENEINERLMQLIHDDGRAFLSSTKINGRFVIRVAILSFRTRLETVEMALDMIDSARRMLERELYGAEVR